MTIPDPTAAISLRPIGVVRSPFVSTSGMPIQTVAAPGAEGSIRVFAEFAAGLRDIEGFEYLIVLTHLHQATEKLEVVPFMDTQSHGVFATRAPARPNRIGLSIIRLVRVEDCVLHFCGNDMLDGTPVLDIKPYVPALDVRQTGRVGWFRQGLQRLPSMLSDDRMK
ncbi:tRNA (N6-threonylcarbamoyladenosine(37)-N6)-methyltransferase TrmO [Diaphorobacter ruginosibacter]|uniref:tRNA (N6-threonylcarbamoyladenosine(37)-N6)-methyltransferase TrmO n=1 Tax=Diaphorobacter ruginosibacter TaxID=1715720 RepID=UPI003341E881